MYLVQLPPSVNVLWVEKISFSEWCWGKEWNVYRVENLIQKKEEMLVLASTSTLQGRGEALCHINWTNSKED